MALAPTGATPTDTLIGDAAKPPPKPSSAPSPEAVSDFNQVVENGGVPASQIDDPGLRLQRLQATVPVTSRTIAPENREAALSGLMESLPATLQATSRTAIADPAAKLASLQGREVAGNVDNTGAPADVRPPIPPSSGASPGESGDTLSLRGFIGQQQWTSVLPTEQIAQIASELALSTPIDVSELPEPAQELVSLALEADVNNSGLVNPQELLDVVQSMGETSGPESLSVDDLVALGELLNNAVEASPELSENPVILSLFYSAGMLERLLNAGGSVQQAQSEGKTDLAEELQGDFNILYTEAQNAITNDTALAAHGAP